ncbi:hypothetical protein B0H17DRAFT_1214426 [Mycena rosella]|uniref:Uncharacterized protein n=1 Tax=Mycena rosella TaxID=1033263 RepID=A0AAD7CN73_MYCRO|nr:hypothetical protein B0H17DRAFT_1214426 [Mycena rosella]
MPDITPELPDPFARPPQDGRHVGLNEGYFAFGPRCADQTAAELRDAAAPADALWIAASEAGDGVRALRASRSCSRAAGTRTSDVDSIRAGCTAHACMCHGPAAGVGVGPAAVVGRDVEKLRRFSCPGESMIRANDGDTSISAEAHWAEEDRQLSCAWVASTPTSPLCRPCTCLVLADSPHSPALLAWAAQRPAVHPRTVGAASQPM